MTDSRIARIHRQKRRSMVMKLTPAGIVVFIPRRYTEHSPAVLAFIEQGLKKLGGRGLPRVPPGETYQPDELRALVAMWAARIGVQPKRVQLREMYRKWGSCSETGAITLSTALCRIARPLAEYVVCHEVAHLRVFGHGRGFKALMTAYMPDWQERQKTLDGLLG